jgi:hypothetical protein
MLLKILQYGNFSLVLSHVFLWYRQYPRVHTSRIRICFSEGQEYNKGPCYLAAEGSAGFLHRLASLHNQKQIATVNGIEGHTHRSVRKFERGRFHDHPSYLASPRKALLQTSL